MPNAQTTVVIGVDGCRAGWLAIVLAASGRWHHIQVFPKISDLWAQHQQARLILVDIPIGLREAGPQERLCDIAARHLLGPKRRSSVFPVPCRSAIYAADYQEACRINQHLTGRRLSRQTWNIVPKIREMDEFLAGNPQARTIIRETHPEVCFWSLAGRPMAHNKKTESGFWERKQVLRAVFPDSDTIINEALAVCKGAPVARDDILDALVVAVTALLGGMRLASLPEEPERDARDLPMEINYCIISNKTHHTGDQKRRC